MGAKAALKALETSGVAAEEIDIILVATMTPDFISPSTAVIVQRLIGAKNAAAVDLQAACTGFIYGLSQAKAYIESGMYKNVLLIASEKMSTFVDYEDRNTCVLFGDGASAAVVSAEGKGLSIDAICLGAAGEMAELLYIPAGGSRQPTSSASIENRQHYIKMEGKELFKHAVRGMSGASKECLAKAGLSDTDVSWLVPHQANVRIMDAVAKNFNIPAERVYKTISKYGNTSASSIAIALDELQQQHSIQAGEHILLVAFGAGLTWGATVLTKL
jgi:3-oxoacyl-[acyl-carrier-protein] synthase-3